MKIAIIALFVAVAFIVSASSAYGANPSTASGAASSSSVPNFQSTSNTVSSGGLEEPYILQQVASASNPNVVYQITGGQIAQRDVSGAYKNYLYLFINTGETFPVNATGQTVKDTVTGYSTNNFYWNVQSPPSSSGSTSFCATVGQDLDLGATSNTLSEWQWSDLNWGCERNQVSYGGSYDGGGPTACNTYSNNQLRESVYEIIVDTSSNSIYQVTGAVLIQQNNNGVASTTYVALVSGTQGRLNTSGDQKDCPVVSNPAVTPSLRWYVRTPPISGMIPGATITGNFGITGTVGAGIAKAPENGNMVFEQFVDKAFQTGYIPNQGAPTDVSILGSTDPVTGNACQWPGTGSCGSTSTTSSSSSSSSVFNRKKSQSICR